MTFTCVGMLTGIITFRLLIGYLVVILISFAMIVIIIMA